MADRTSRLLDWIGGRGVCEGKRRGKRWAYGIVHDYGIVGERHVVKSG